MVLYNLGRAYELGPHGSRAHGTLQSGPRIRARPARITRAWYFTIWAAHTSSARTDHARMVLYNLGRAYELAPHGSRAHGTLQSGPRIRARPARITRAWYFTIWAAHTSSARTDHARMVLYNLGRAYELGECVLQDWAKAVHFYRLAAEQGHAAAQFSLGLSFIRGIGVGEASPRLQLGITLIYEDGAEVEDLVHAGTEPLIEVLGVQPPWTDEVRAPRLAVASARRRAAAGARRGRLTRRGGPGGPQRGRRLPAGRQGPATGQRRHGARLADHAAAARAARGQHAPALLVRAGYRHDL
jgi:hypothetical protein